MTNWERKSSYLLREIVKFRTYIDSLAAAQVQKDKIYAVREAEAAKEEETTGVLKQQPQLLAVETDGGVEAPKASHPQPVFS
jgi:hypothetical protein